MRLRARRRLALALVLPLVLPACGESPTEPEDVLEVVVAGGDGQFGLAGQPLDQPLEALVRHADTGEPQGGVPIEWTVRAGVASIGASVGATDAEGRVRTSVTLGVGTDTVRIRATVRAHPEYMAAFEAYVTERPQLADLSHEVARGGDTITLTGSGFSATPGSNVVLFSGIRGRVFAAEPGELVVEVPPCLATRTVGVTTQLGAFRSDPLPLQVEDGGRFTELDRGEFLDVDETERVTCLRVEGGGARYLVTPLASGMTGAARYPYLLNGLGQEPGPAGAPASGASTVEGVGAPFAARWEAALRDEEGRIVRAGPPHLRVVAGARAPAAAPTVGDERTFSVLNADGGFDQVTAVVRVVGEHSVLYMDRSAPTGGLDDGDLTALMASFDDVSHPTVTGAYGQPSDLDGNGRVAILFTPTVNALTPRGSDGFVGGFFYGLDLLDLGGSNRGEVFYAVVPDPAGVHSDPRGKAKILQVVPAILAHEFQHMIHFNERVLELGAAGSEALWLSEGLAQMAEELVARAHDARGDAAAAVRFREGNDDRARRYLEATDAASLIVATGQGSLAERGAGWLFTLYLWDVTGRGDILARLTRTTLTGTANVVAMVGQAWRHVLAGWGAALALDGASTPGMPFDYPTIDLQARFGGANGPYPLVPEVVEDGDFTRAGSLWSSSFKHYIVIPPSAAGTTLRLGGAAGGGAPTEAGLRLRVLRIL